MRLCFSFSPRARRSKGIDSLRTPDVRPKLSLDDWSNGVSDGDYRTPSVLGRSINPGPDEASAVSTITSAVFTFGVKWGNRLLCQQPKCPG
ncbi:jg16738 [Pararge aegeria aegeria]|uniref:Jg16738 protein n=1 Tax=Pararge aegeria aegeria TaxID=348720 RepID=A0A8S4S331_9NEOP|nr:jg16738 [Pararge aegeria aegeria]